MDARSLFCLAKDPFHGHWIEYHHTCWWIHGWSNLQAVCMIYLLQKIKKATRNNIDNEKNTKHQVMSIIHHHQTQPTTGDNKEQRFSLGFFFRCCLILVRVAFFSFSFKSLCMKPDYLELRLVLVQLEKGIFQRISTFIMYRIAGCSFCCQHTYLQRSSVSYQLQQKVATT